MDWYAIMVRSGYEKKVEIALTERIRQEQAADKFGDIFVPMMESGKKRKDGTKILKSAMPGYMFIEVDLDDSMWHLVKSVTNVNTFVGDKTPKPVNTNEIKALRGDTEAAEILKKKVKYAKFEKGETVKIISGAFMNFTGVVQQSTEKKKVKLNVSIFGRDTSVEIGINDIEKM